MYIKPMLLSSIPSPFESESWITELKFDGMRLILSHFNGRIQLYSRHHREWTWQFPEFQMVSIPEGTILDGELIVQDEQGKPNFEGLMERVHSKRSKKDVLYCVFDILYFDSVPVMNLPLLERKKLLKNKIEPSTHLLIVPYIIGNASTYFSLITQNQLEGIVQKKISPAGQSFYYPGIRSSNWLKIVNYIYSSVCIYGYRKSKFGLFINYQEDPVGVVEYMSAKDRKQFYSHCLIIKETDTYCFIRPINCVVKFRNWTKKGNMRLPIFVSFQ